MNEPTFSNDELLIIRDALIGYRTDREAKPVILTPERCQYFVDLCELQDRINGLIEANALDKEEENG